MIATIILAALWFVAVPFLLGIMFSLGWHTAKCLFRHTMRTTTVIQVGQGEEADHGTD